MNIENFGITEAELNAEIEEHSAFTEYTLEDLFWNNQVEAQKINMNPYSLNFFIKSLFCENSSAVYLGSFINFFQELDISTIGEPKRYNACSHAITLYTLKMLEKNGVVKIIEYHPVTRIKNSGLYSMLVKNTKKPKTRMYDVLFYKLRDLEANDIATIKRIEKGLKIKKHQIRIKSRSKKLETTLGPLEVLKSILTGRIFYQLKKNINYWRKDEGFKANINNALYSLKSQKN